MSGSESIREVIHEHEFDEQLAALIHDLEAADEFTAGAKWVLARDPETGLLASATLGIWALPMSPIHGRQVTLYYAFDEHAVTLLSIVTLED